MAADRRDRRLPRRRGAGAPTSGAPVVASWAGRAWLLVLVIGAVAGLLDAAGAAINARLRTGAAIPVFHWLLTAAPAAVAVAVSGARSGRGRGAAALGTGVVTLPLLTATWALADVGPAVGRLPEIVMNTVLLGAVPLAVVVALARGLRHRPSDAEPPR